MKFETWDMIDSPLFWKGIVLEVYMEKVQVSFFNKLFWIKTVNKIIFDADAKRLTKAKEIKKDGKEEYYNANHKDEVFITNDMI